MKDLIGKLGIYDFLTFLTPGVTVLAAFQTGFHDSFLRIPTNPVALTLYSYVLGHIASQAARAIEAILQRYWRLEKTVRDALSAEHVASIESCLGKVFDSALAAKTIHLWNNPIVLEHIDIHMRNRVFSRNMLLPLMLLGAALFADSQFLFGIVCLSALPLFVARYFRHSKKYIRDVFEYCALSNLRIRERAGDR